MTARKNKVNFKRATQTKLYRSEKNRVLGGVAGGFAEIINIDPVIVRIVFVILALSWGSGLVLYIILWMLIPTKSQIKKTFDESVKNNVDEIKEKAGQISSEIESMSGKKSTRRWLGVVLIAFGALLLLGNFGFANLFNILRLWPLIIVLIGIKILSKND